MGTHDHHHHHHTDDANERRLWLALALTAGFTAAEIIAGLLTNSLALISDAAHMFTDAAALAVSLVAIRIAKRAADRKRTFGYYRFEILAAAFNASALFVVAAYILYEAYGRFFAPPEIHTTGMLIVAVLGLGINLVAMALLRAGNETSLNVKGAYLEVWSDALASVGVIAAAIVIYFTGWRWIDPLVAVLIGFWVLPRTWTLLKTSLNILLEGVPEGLALDEIEQALLATPGVDSVHDLHVWALSSGKNSLSAHLVVDTAKNDEQRVLRAASGALDKHFAIKHATLQIECEPCPQTEDGAAGHFSAHRH